MKLEVEKDEAADLSEVHEESGIDHVAIFDLNMINQILVNALGPYKSIVSHAFNISYYLFLLRVCWYIIHEHHDDKSAGGNSESLLLLLVSPVFLIEYAIIHSSLLMQVRKSGI